MKGLNHWNLSISQTIVVIIVFVVCFWFYCFTCFIFEDSCIVHFLNFICSWCFSMPTNRLLGCEQFALVIRCASVIRLIHVTVFFLALSSLWDSLWHSHAPVKSIMPFAYVVHSDPPQRHLPTGLPSLNSPPAWLSPILGCSSHITPCMVYHASFFFFAF